MSGSKVTPITNSFSCAPSLLQKDHALWGILENVEPVGGGLVQVRVVDLDRLLPEELALQLQSLVGKNVSICRVEEGYWVGELKA
jgi:hypothetical protein